MNFTAMFISRPVATTLLTVAIALAGGVAFFQLPVAPLPQVDYPTISVRAKLPGASPQVMATAVATPLERHLGKIADVTEMTSSSLRGSTSITLQFGLDRDIDGAARDVQAAINAARADLPSNLVSNPTYNKVNPADSPILILALTSTTLTQGQIYDAADTVIRQKLSQIHGVGEVRVTGSSLPAVRVELNPFALVKYGIGLEAVRAALSSANARSPKGAIEDGNRRFQIHTNDQASQASDYESLVIAHRNGAPVRLSDVADVSDSVETRFNFAFARGQAAVLVVLYRMPGANIIDTIDRVTAQLPLLEASIPSAITTSIADNRSTTIRASLHDTELTLIIAACLVIMVVFLFLGDARATVIPIVAVPVSLIGTFGVMYLLGYSIDSLSLMALTIATGFVVDDAIVVLENIKRHIEAGRPRFEAALLGAREVGFTVTSMSLSLIAAFIPLLLMSGIIGRLFREFAVTLSVAILVSLVVSLTTTPMMCARLLRRSSEHRPGPVGRTTARAFDATLGLYRRTLNWALVHPLAMIMVLCTTVCLNLYLFIVVPKGFFPRQDSARVDGFIAADQSTSFQLLNDKVWQVMTIVENDPAVRSAVGFNFGYVYLTLKPRNQRDVTSDEVIARLGRKVEQVSGVSLYLYSAQDIQISSREGSAGYQYTLKGDNLDELYSWAPKVTAALQSVPEITQVKSDQKQRGLETYLNIDRDSAARLGVTVSQIANTLYDAFGERQVSTIFNPLNQYHVVMAVQPQYSQSPEILREIYVSTSGGEVGGAQATAAIVAVARPTAGAADPTAAVRNQRTNAIGISGHRSASTGAAVSTTPESMVPLWQLMHYEFRATPVSVQHQGNFVATTISFNLAPGKSLSDAIGAINAAVLRVGLPSTIHGTFEGTARAFQKLITSELYLVLAAILFVYIVLGILYESYVHPITILSSLPSAGVGAVLALMVLRTEFSIISLIGVILLIGIVKKNAILMIDFAINAERHQGLAPRDAIHQACLLRFRPIMMTTMSALLGTIPLTLGFGEGGEVRQALGISIAGGLIASQLLTLYTTPVVYLYLDRFRLWCVGPARSPTTRRSAVAETRRR
jgi:multidrug efflux pump